MGFAISWIAFKTEDKEDVLRLLGLADTGEPDEANETPVSGAVLPTGWFVVFFNDYGFVKPERLARLSAGRVILACQVEEHVMASVSFCYRDGRQVWSVSHLSERGTYDLTATGDLPEAFAELRDRLFREQESEGGAQADVDCIFDIPVELAAGICGYRHDQCEFDWGEPAFSELALAAGRRQ